MLVFIAGPPHSGSQREWMFRFELARRVTFETGGLTKRFFFAIVDAGDVCRTAGRSRAHIEALYRRAWAWDDQDQDNMATSR